MRSVFPVLAVAVAALVWAGAGGGTTPLRLQVTFTGTAQGQFNDVERWTSLADNTCVLRRSRDEGVSIGWSLAWRGTPGGRATSAAPAVVHGSVAGTEVRDSCDIAPSALPADAPADWLRTVACNDPLQAESAGTLALVPRKKALVVAVATPAYAVDPDAQCTAEPRSGQLQARVPVGTATLERLGRGSSLTFRIGSSLTRYGSYVTRLNCMHPAKPYDGYRSYDQCSDLLTWSGTLRVTRL